MAGKPRQPWAVAVYDNFGGDGSSTPSTQKAKILVGKFLDILAKSIEPIREGRSYPRNHLSYKKIYHPNIKRTR